MAGRVVVSAAASVDRTLSVTNGNTPATMVIRNTAEFDRKGSRKYVL